jgi:hypothetical protein
MTITAKSKTILDQFAQPSYSQVREHDPLCHWRKERMIDKPLAPS